MTPNRSGRHFLQIPGPTNVPDRVLRAMAQPTIDHRGDEFSAITREVLAGLQGVFKNSGPVIVYPSSATGAWEAAFVNTMSPGDKVLSFEIGEFARLWAELARRLGLEVEVVDTDWTRAVDPADVEARLSADREHRIKAILVVQTRPRPAPLPAWRKFAVRSIARSIRRCSSSMRCRRSPRSISVRTNGASTSSSPDRRKG